MPTAKSVLDKYWDGKLPVGVRRIADAMGVVVISNPMMLESGTISIESGRPVVEFNGTDAPVRQRFTIAHELGHFALGHLKDGAKRFRDPASNFSSRTNVWEEREANSFAAQLLMPAETLKYAVTEKSIVDIARLAELFGVSQLAMKYRLANLGLIHA